MCRSIPQHLVSETVDPTPERSVGYVIKPLHMESRLRNSNPYAKALDMGLAKLMLCSLLMQPTLIGNGSKMTLVSDDTSDWTSVAIRLSRRYVLENHASTRLAWVC